MEREEDIRLRRQVAVYRANLAREIQRKYVAYINGADQGLLSDIINLLDKNCSSKVRKILKQTNCYSDVQMEDILQEARNGVWQRLEKHRKNGEVKDNFAAYGMMIYKNKAYDFVSKVKKERDRLGEMASIEQTLEQYDGIKGRGIFEDIRKDKNMMEGFLLIMQEYCKQVMESSSKPPRILALCYARILPHIIHSIREYEIDREKLSNNIGWACEIMGDRTILQLSCETEEIFQKDISPSLSWGEKYLSHLEKNTIIEEKELPLKEVVYTAAFSRKKMGDWIYKEHGKVLSSLLNTVNFHNDLMKYMKDYNKIKAMLKDKGGNDDGTFK